LTYNTHEPHWGKMKRKGGKKGSPNRSFTKVLGSRISAPAKKKTKFTPRKGGLKNQRGRQGEKFFKNETA